MIDIRDAEHFKACVAHAKALGAWDCDGGLRDCLRRLSNVHNWRDEPGYARRQRVTLFKDFAPFSWEFQVWNLDERGGGRFVYNGGLLFYAGRESGAGGPQFSVTLSGRGDARWEIHT